MKDIHYILLFLLLLGTRHHASAQLNETTFEGVEALMKKEQRPVFIFIHTSWCTYCKAMESTVFKDKNIVEILNKNFYFIRLNAEEKRNITFLNKTFTYQPAGPETGIHELAQELGNIDGKLSYPVLCILNSRYEISFQHNAYLNKKELLKVLRAVLK